MTDYLIYLKISESCLWNGRPSLHQDEGLVLTDTSDNKQKFGCVNKCVLTNNEVYIIAQEASGNENNNSVSPLFTIDNTSLGPAQLSGKYTQKQTCCNVMFYMFYTYFCTFRDY